MSWDTRTEAQKERGLAYHAFCKQIRATRDNLNPGERKRVQVPDILIYWQETVPPHPSSHLRGRVKGEVDSSMLLDDLASSCHRGIAPDTFCHMRVVGTYGTLDVSQGVYVDMLRVSQK